MDEVDQMIKDLIEQGLLKEVPDPITGQMFYKVSPEAEALFPKLWETNIRAMQKDISRLWSLGFVEYEFGETPAKDMVALTDKAYDEEAVRSLSIDDAKLLNKLLDAFLEEEYNE